VLAQALADRMGVGFGGSAGAARGNDVVGQLHMPWNYDPQQDDSLPERMIANLSETFAEVMGEAPWQQE
jgi:hypothetical protein